jgi:hypothetical protein
MVKYITQDEDGLLIPRERRRNSTAHIGGVKFFGSGSSPAPTSYSREQLIETQVTRDRKNLYPWVQHQLRKGGVNAASVEGLRQMDLGWSFFTERLRRSTSLSNFQDSQRATTLNQSWGVEHLGPVFLQAAVHPFQPWNQAEIEDAQQIAWGLGATAIRRSSPNKPVIDLATTIGELRSEGLPSMFGSIISRSKTLRDLAANGGKEYLNAQFGWAPLMRDVQALATEVLATRKRLEQYYRDLSREIRRRYSFPEISEVTSTTSTIQTDGEYWVQGNTPLGASTGRYFTYHSSAPTGTTVVKSVQNSWFSGAFRYLNATEEHDMNTLQKFEEDANALLGTRIDPEVLWNLQPWTWLADWFVNYGDVLGNISSITADRQVMHYGYIMRTVESHVEYSVPGLWAASGPTGLGRTRVAGPFHNKVTTVRKHRGAASPFGFGLNPDSFTASQWAILGALGISKVR